eukprot:4386162-Amphidinium_carterae.1
MYRVTRSGPKLRHTDTRTHGRTDARTHGRTDVRTYGRTDARARTRTQAIDLNSGTRHTHRESSARVNF